MATTLHKNLTGADLHEPKGAASASSGQVYVSDGLGSGVWTTVANLVTAGGFSTGDTKLTWKTAADTGWIMADDGTIGDGSSSATTRANADCSALFVLIWTNFSNALAAVLPGGRGASAAADFAAHKTIALPKLLSRTISVAGSGSGLTTRTLGSLTGAESIQLGPTNIPTITSVNASQTINVSTSGITAVLQNTTTVSVRADLLQQSVWTGGALGAAASTGVNSISVTSNNTAAGALGNSFSLMQPSAFMNVMVKL